MAAYPTNDHDVALKIETLPAHVDQALDQAALLALLQRRVDALERRQGGGADESAPCSEPPPSIACYCIVQVMGPSAPSFASAIAMAQMLFFSLSQFVLCMGFFDSIWLKYILSSYPVYTDPIRNSVFYVSKTFYANCEDGIQSSACAWAPHINVYCSMIAIILLASGPLMNEDGQSLLTMQPIEYLLFDDEIWSARAWERGARGRTALLLLWRVMAAAVMQLSWAARVLIVPAMGLMGTSVALAGTFSAFDIVLNSVRATSDSTRDSAWRQRTIPRVARAPKSLRVAPRNRLPLGSSSRSMTCCTLPCCLLTSAHATKRATATRRTRAIPRTRSRFRDQIRWRRGTHGRCMLPAIERSGPSHTSLSLLTVVRPDFDPRPSSCCWSTSRSPCRRTGSCS